jgi:DNA-binding transcriptional LysR family regulator
MDFDKYSAQIRQLEEVLGERLFSRSTPRLTLTDPGQLVLGYAEEIFALGQELITALGQEPSQRPHPASRGGSDYGERVILKR